MAAIISSTCTAGNAQADGRQYIAERHTDGDGVVYDFSYLADVGTDINLVLTERAAILNTQLAAKAAAQAIVFGTTLPLSPYEFLSRMTPQERIGIRTSASTDPVIADFMALLDRADVVHPMNPDVQMGLGYFVQQGILSADRAAVIGAA